MVKKADPKELWRGWVMFYQTPDKAWWPVGSYKTRGEASTQALIYSTTNDVKTKVKRAKTIGY